ncbi:Neurofibromin [Armadillidium vulgare]|nr:Neurofibromin [Armadillidium vulgare]
MGIVSTVKIHCRNLLNRLYRIENINSSLGIEYDRDSVQVHQKIRPKDVPGTLLNMALLNLGSLDPNLRTAAYNLLCALTQTFDLRNRRATT